MATHTLKKANSHSWINDTWLAPYCGYIVRLVEYKNGRLDMHLNGALFKNLEGSFTASNNWRYTLKKLLR